MRKAQRGDVPASRETAGSGDVRLGDVERLGPHEVAESECRVLALATCDRNAERSPDVAIAGEVLGHHGLFIPAQRIRLERAAEANGVCLPVSVVRVDHQCHRAVAERRADRLHDRKVVLDAESELDLHHPQAGLVVSQRLGGEPVRFALALHPIEPGGVGPHTAPERAAEEAPYRLAAGLAAEIPERDVDAADAAHHSSLPAVVARAVVHAMPEHLRLARIATDQHGREHGPDCRRGDVPRLQADA